MPRSIIFVLALCVLCAAWLVAPVREARGALALLLAALGGAALGRAALVERGGRAEARAAQTKLPDTAERPRTARASTLLEATMDGMREGLLVLDEEARVISSNPAAREIFNHLKGRLEGKRLSELTRNPSIHAAFRRALAEGSRAEARVEIQGNARRAFDLRVVPLRPEEGPGGRGAIGVFYDITRLERLERVRQEFFSNVSHELRTPLTSILAFIETLEAGAIDDPAHARRFLGIIARNAARMHALVNDILELSQIEAGQVRLDPTPVRLCPLASEVAAALAARAGARGVTVEVEIEPEALVLADARRLEQMLTNLLDNAIKFNREGGRVRVSHRREARDLILVSDTGEGIPPQHVERIFERFYRVDAARSREQGGTGLGLSIVKHLARAHGGEARVSSIPGEGSTFTIELPPLPQPAPVHNSQELSESQGAGPT